MEYFLCIIFLLPVYCYTEIDEKQYLSYPRTKVLERFMEGLPIRRNEWQSMAGNDRPNLILVQKRNNAELVNHILKNLNGLDHLGDIGR